MLRKITFICFLVLVLLTTGCVTRPKKPADREFREVPAALLLPCELPPAPPTFTPRWLQQNVGSESSDVAFLLFAILPPLQFRDVGVQSKSVSSSVRTISKAPSFGELL